MVSPVDLPGKYCASLKSHITMVGSVIPVIHQLSPGPLSWPWGQGVPEGRAWLLSILESLPLDLGTSVVKWGKAYDTVWVFIGPNHRQSLPSSGVMEKIKLPHSHVSAFCPFSFANRKCLFKYSSLQNVLEPSEKPKMSTLAPLRCSGHHLAVGEKWASACL